MQVFRITTPLRARIATVTQLPEVIDIAEDDMWWLRRTDSSFNDVKILVEMVDDKEISRGLQMVK